MKHRRLYITVAVVIAFVFISCSLLFPVITVFADDNVEHSESAENANSDSPTEEQHEEPSEETEPPSEEQNEDPSEEQFEPVSEEVSEEPLEEATEEFSEEATEEATEELPVRRLAKDNAEPEIKDVMSLDVSLDGDYVVIRYKTKHANPWDYCYQAYPIHISYADGSSGEIGFNWDGTEVHGRNWSQIEGSSVGKSEDQSDTETAEVRIPVSWFTSLDFTLSSEDYETTLNAGDVPSEEESEDSEAVYSGIVIDGNFSDWDAVSKYDLQEPDGDNNVECVAWMIEDDYVYIYIKDMGTNSATWAGPNHNGKFAITTDLGRTLVLQLNEDGMVTGADGIESVHNGSQWEIAVPMDMIPQNNGGLDFGLYLFDSSISGQAEGGNIGSSTGIEYDGVYGDWDSYPHKEIQYSTAGTHENVPDGEAAIYFDNMIYGHCVTQMQQHLDERGGEYTQGVSVIVNDDWSHALYMRPVTVDDDGNIDWNPQVSGLDDGSHEYYIFGTDAWGSSDNISNLVKADVCYGKLMVTIQDGRQDAEWYVDPDKLAARYGYDVTDMKTISSQYIRIGNEVVTTAGTSTGPLGSVLLMLSSTLVPCVFRKKLLFGLIG